MTFGGVPIVAPAMRETPMASDDAVLDFARAVIAGTFDAVVFLTGVGVRALADTATRAGARDAFLEALRGAGVWVEDIHIGELDDGTIVEKHMGHAKYDDGRVVDFPTCTTYGFKDGKIYDVRVHTGGQHVVDAYFWWKFPLKPIPARLAE